MCDRCQISLHENCHIEGVKGPESVSHIAEYLHKLVNKVKEICTGKLAQQMVPECAEGLCKYFEEFDQLWDQYQKNHKQKDLTT